MNTDLRAAFVLTLEDRLTAGLNKIEGALDHLAGVGRRLGLGKLEGATDALHRVSGAAEKLSHALRGVGNMAERAWGSVKRVGQQAFGAESRLGAFGAAAQGYSVIEPIRKYAEIDTIARHSAITEGLSGNAAEAETQRLIKLFQSDALASRQSSASIGQAFQDMIQTGLKPQVAEQLLPIHSRAATAYNIDPEALGHAVAALSMNLGIGEKAMSGALASMALAAKSGRFKIEDFSRALPGITGNMRKLGMTGRGSADTVFAALETVMKNSSDASTGATNFSDFMNYLTSPMAARSFALQSRMMAPATKTLLAQNHITGIDMPALLADARKRGQDPITAVLDVLQGKLKGLAPDVMAEVMGAFFHNQQARDAAIALLQHRGSMAALHTKEAGADPAQLNRDFTTAVSAPQKKLDLLGEQLTQIGQRVGQGFLPVLNVMIAGLGRLMQALDWLDQKFPGLGNDVLGVIGGMLALGAAVAGIGFVMPAVSAGLGMFSPLLNLAGVAVRGLALGSRLLVGGLYLLGDVLAGVSVATFGVMAAIAAVALVLAAAAWDIYSHWAVFRPFFAALWRGVENMFVGFADFVIGIFTGNLSRAWSGIRQVWSGAGTFFAALWNIVKQLFVDFGAWIDGWSGGAMTAAVARIKAAWSGLKAFFLALWADIRRPFDQFAAAVMNNPVTRLLHLSGAAQVHGPGAPAGAGADGGAGAAAAGAPRAGAALAVPAISGHITVGVDPNSGRINITRTASSTPGVGLFSGAPDAGAMLAVP